MNPTTNVTGFKQTPLRAHSFLAGVPLHSVDRIDLPGGRPGMDIGEISRAFGFGDDMEMETGFLTKALFWLRGQIGRLMRWDDDKTLIDSVTYLSRLSDEDRARTAIVPGAPSGISRILYQFENEMLGEIVNRTVHCFWVLSRERRASGYTLWMAVYVRKLNWFTPIYMALISPILKWIIYPAMLKGGLRRWEKLFPPGRFEDVGSKSEKAAFRH